MISLLIWSVGIALELILVVRGVQQGLFRRYPAFYSYIAFVFANRHFGLCGSVQLRTFIFISTGSLSS